MSRTLKLGTVAAALALAAPLSAANAADLLPEPPVVHPQPPAPKAHAWYLRGDIGYTHWQDPEVEFLTSGGTLISDFDSSESLKGAINAGVGIGYQLHKHFRADVTFDLRTKADYHAQQRCVAACGGISYHDQYADLSVYTLMANAYVDLGTYGGSAYGKGGFTPYVGAGIGGSYVKWNSYSSVANDQSQNQLYAGNGEWRWTAALHAGVSHKISDRMSLDANYRYQYIDGGKVTDVFTNTIEDKALHAHDFRLGLRYQFGHIASYEQPAGQPIYYK